MNDWEESSVKIQHVGMKHRLTEADTFDHVEEAAERPPPPWIDEDIETQKWESKREEAIKKMRQDLTYQFVMLLSGFTNEKMSKYWTRNETASGKRGTIRGEGAECSVDVPDNYNCGSDGDQKKYHDWYVNTSWADGMIYLTPMVYGHMEEAFTALTQRFEHLRTAKLENFIESPRIRSIFARLVAMCIRISDVLSGKKYHLNSTYKRIHMERQRIMNVFRHVRLRTKEMSWEDVQKGLEAEQVLVFEKDESNPMYASVDTKWDSAQALRLKNELLELNKRKKFFT